MKTLFEQYASNASGCGVRGNAEKVNRKRGLKMHKVLMADELIAVEQLDRFLQEGWLLIQILETTINGEPKYVFYFRRES